MALKKSIRIRIRIRNEFGRSRSGKPNRNSAERIGDTAVMQMVGREFFFSVAPNLRNIWMLLYQLELKTNIKFPNGTNLLTSTYNWLFMVIWKKDFILHHSVETVGMRAIVSPCRRQLQSDSAPRRAWVTGSPGWCPPPPRKGQTWATYVATGCSGSYCALVFYISPKCTCLVFSPPIFFMGSIFFSYYFTRKILLLLLYY